MQRFCMLIIKMWGGLGNQMFIYAFGKALESYGYTICFDVEQYNQKKQRKESDGITTRHLEITNFKTTLPLLNDSHAIKQIHSQHTLPYKIYSILRKSTPKLLRKPLFAIFDKKYNNFLWQDSQELRQKMREKQPSFPQYAYFQGYFQEIKYFESIIPALQQDFQLLKPLTMQNQKTRQTILRMKDPVFLHIRRGDYLNSNNANFIKLGTTYYNTALHYISTHLESPSIFVFSDDIEWCKQHFVSKLDQTLISNLPFSFIDNNTYNAIEEMELMRSCKHAIIANSTFSWWAAFLLSNPQKIIIAPSQKNYTSTIQDMQRFYPQEWIIVDHIWGDIVNLWNY